MSMGVEQVLEIRPQAEAILAAQWSGSAALLIMTAAAVVVCILRPRLLITLLLFGGGAALFVGLAYLSTTRFYRLEAAAGLVRFVSLANESTYRCADVEDLRVLTTHRGSCSIQVRARSASALSTHEFQSLESGNRALCANLHEKVQRICFPR